MTQHPERAAAPDAEQDAAPPRRSLAARVALSLAAAAVALAAAEATLHIVGCQVRADRLVRDPLLGWRNKPGWRGPVFSINSLGFLGPEFSPAKPGGTLRIFCLGDSCTAGDLLADFEHTYPRQLRRLLRERRPQRRIEVVNAGVGGYSSFQGRLWLEREILGYQPDLLVLCFGWNDHWPARLAGEDKLVAGSWTERVRAGLSWCKLLQLTIKAYHNVRGQAALPGRAATGVAVPRSGRGPRVSLADYEANLRAMARAVRERGGEAVVVTAPNYLAMADSGTRTKAEKALVALHARYNDVVRRVAREDGLCLVDAAKRIPQLNNSEKLFWRPPGDFIHLSAEGYRRLADAVAACPAVTRLVEGR